MKVSELYMRAVKYAVDRGFSAKDDTCEWRLGGYRWFFNGKRETVQGVPFGHLAVFNGSDLPVVLVSPGGGNVIGDMDAEDKLIGLLKKEQPVDLEAP